MKVRARLHGFGHPPEREVDVPEGTTADELCDAMGIPAESVIVFRGDDPLPGDAPVEAGETLRVLRIVSGGAGVREAKPQD